MALARDLRAPAADQEVEIGAAIGLKHPLNVKVLVAPAHGRRRRRPIRVAPAKFVVNVSSVEGRFGGAAKSGGSSASSSGRTAKPTGPARTRAELAARAGSHSAASFSGRTRRGR